MNYDEQAAEGGRRLTMLMILNCDDGAGSRGRTALDNAHDLVLQGSYHITVVSIFYAAEMATRIIMLLCFMSVRSAMN
eukprot:scaffold878_cov135-Chaetoceros_neogracile.AAC.2